MIIVLKPDASEQQVQWIQEKLQRQGLQTRLVVGSERSVLAVIGQVRPDAREVAMLPGVSQVIRVSRPYKLASREAHPEATVVQVGRVAVGGPQVVVMAGPCSVESRPGLLEVAQRVREAGASILRGGAFKPRTSPYSFQGLGEEGLRILAEAREKFGLPVVTEVVSPSHVDLVAEHADLLQIGARNMQNFELLKAVAQTGKPVLLKRGLAATIEEFLMAAEYILAGGRSGVILCERGIRTFEPSTRHTLDLSSIPVIRELSHLPIIVDPSHGTGHRSYVPAMALAAVAAGADGLMVEVHPNPPEALSDGAQSLYPEQLVRLMRDIAVIAPVVGRQVEGLHRRHRPAASGPTGTRARVVYQGEPGAFSEKAVHQYFGPGASTLPVPTFAEVLENVASGACEYGMLPLENSLTGSVHRNYELLLEHPEVHIVGEIKLRIVHNLIANPGVEMADIRKIYAHPQAAAQCERFLRQHPEWEVHSVYDTAGSVRHVRDRGLVDAAAIASSEAADLMGMQILRQGIETHPRNFTRFVVLSRQPAEAEGADKVSVVFDTEDRPGALYRTLGVFAERGINLHKLESRPIEGKPWEYMFYADLQVPQDRATLEEALARLHEMCPFCRVLGRYRSAD